MKKLVIFFVFSFIILGVSGCGKTATDASDTVSVTGANDKPLIQTGEIIEQKTQGDAQSENTPGIETTMEAIIKEGKDVTCQISFNESGMTIEGTFYLAADMKTFRMDMTVNAPEGINVKSHILNESDTSYMRQEGIGRGSKMKIKKDDQGNQILENDDSFNKIMNFKCKSWKIDQAIISVPKDIEFLDLDEMMKKFDVDSLKK